MKGSFQREFWEVFHQTPAQYFKAESNSEFSSHRVESWFQHIV
jgi:hypothetical protein